MEVGEIISNKKIKNDYYEVKFYLPEAVDKAVAGQFVHVRINEYGDRILRRPFSIHNVQKDGSLSVVYKVIGHGTKQLSELGAGKVCDIMAPLGEGYSSKLDEDVIPVMIAGGYGSAAMYLLTEQIKQRGILLIGARNKEELILEDRYEKANYDVRIATNDGSVGKEGFVTLLLEELIANNPNKKFYFYGCGPHGMLMAVAKILQKNNMDGELSVDHVMCCGIGACFACVVKVKDEFGNWRYARSCSEGPVFKLNEVYTGE